MTFIHPFDDAIVMAGRARWVGTAGTGARLEAVVVPIGGGGLICGIACAIKESRPEVRVIGVQTSRLPSMLAARLAGHPVTVEPATTIADGIAVRRAGDVTLPVVERYVDEIVTVDEDEIASAILVLLEREKTLAEGAGATALAALLQKKTSLNGAHTAVMVCGGNIDVTLLSRIIERGLVQDGRMIRLRIHLLDKPGALADLTRLIASYRDEYCGHAAQSRLLRCESGRYGDRHYDGDAGTGAGGGVTGCADGRKGYKHSRVL
jgi:threonine dehydratase